MKLLLGITLLLFAALTNAAPRSPAVFQAYQPYEVEDRQDLKPMVFWPQTDAVAFAGQDDSFEDSNEPDDDYFETEDTFFQSRPFYDTINVNRANEDNIPALTNDNNLIFKALENRIAEDVRRMMDDSFLFQKLFGQTRPWSFPNLIPDASEAGPDNSPSPFDNSPFFPNNDDENDDGFNFFSGLRPLFPGLLPAVPGVGFAKPGDFPDNYNNVTYEVHEVNGTKVTVNNTINKNSGDNFNSFFRHQVIHVRPGQEESGKGTEETFEVTTVVPATEIPQETSEDGEDEINTVLPEVDNESNSNGNINPEAIPKVKPEADFDNVPEIDGPLPEVSELFGQLSENSRKEVLSRSLREFNPIAFPADDPNAHAIPFQGPKSAAYVASNSLDGNEEDFEKVETGDKGTRAPDLSKDTRVNRVHTNKQGIVQQDPDAEIFNYSLVLKESQPRDGDQ